MTQHPTPEPSGQRRLFSAIAEILLAVGMCLGGICAWSILWSGWTGALVGTTLVLVGCALFFHALGRLTVDPSPVSAVSTTQVAPPGHPYEQPWRTFQEALAQHGDELTEIPSPQHRQQILLLWRERIDQEAHDYTDLVAGHPRREEISRLEVEALLYAYLAGYLAGRGWLEARWGEQGHFVVGRALRDRLRGIGVPLESVMLTIGVVIDSVLGEICAIGLAEGREQEANRP